MIFVSIHKRKMITPYIFFLAQCERGCVAKKIHIHTEKIHPINKVKRVFIWVHHRKHETIGLVYANNTV